MDFLSNPQWQKYVQMTIDRLQDYSPKFIAAAFVLCLGWFIIGQIMRLIRKAFQKTNFDESIESFLQSLISIGLKVALLINVAGILGIEMTTFVAIFGAVALAIGLALRGSIANFAGGILILIFKPFRVGDYVEAQGFNGTVQKIEILYTTLKTPHNELAVIPNGELSNNPMLNYSRKGTRRVDMTFGIGYKNNIEEAEEILKKIIEEEETILKSPEPEFHVGELGASSVDLLVRVFARTNDSWTLPYKVNRKVKFAFDEAGISIPFPQRDIHHHYPEESSKQD